MPNLRPRSPCPNQNLDLPHKDNVFEVEKAIDVTELMSRYGYRLQLAKEKEERPFQFQCAYIRIGIQERGLKNEAGEGLQRAIRRTSAHCAGIFGEDRTDAT